MRFRKHYLISRVGPLAMVAVLTSGCFQVSDSLATAEQTSAATTATNSTLTLPEGASAIRAARIIFSTGASGSFDAAPANGTPAVAGSGHPAVRLFTPANTLLVEGNSSTSGWPAWISRVEVGISGTSNASSTAASCARFADASDSASLCDFDKDSVFTDECGAPLNTYRVSEYDCVRGAATTDGTGGASDGVYIRVKLGARGTTLGTQENLMAVLTYSSSTLRAGPVNPTVCFSNIGFDPTNPLCADMVWNLYLKTTSSETPDPHLMMIPPSLTQVIGGLNPGKTGSSVSSRQIILPLASNPDVTEFQFSRVRGLSEGYDTNDFRDRCNGLANPSNSSGCMGVTFYNLTLYRI